MSDASDTEKLHALVLLLKMRGRTTDELLSIWTENDRRNWQADEIDAARAVLLERSVKVPEQKEPVVPPAHPQKQYWDDWFWDPFSKQSIAIRKVGCLAIGGAILLMLVQLLLSLLFRW